MNPQQKEFLQTAAAQAKKAGHVFPEMAACEAALESGHPDPVTKVSIYGGSQLAREGNNLFGMKEHRHNAYGVMRLPAHEFENSEWIVTETDWEKYPDWASCFADRMTTLSRLSSFLPHYAAALAAKTPEEFVNQVSQSWSTDPGWHCRCGMEFIREVDAKAHEVGHAATYGVCEVIPGLGRALKVLSIYKACAEDWNATA